MSRGQYITIKWANTIRERLDIFTVSHVLNGRRAEFLLMENVLTICVDDIWKDTQNFDDFVDGLNVVFLTEMCCQKYHLREGQRFFQSTDLLCKKTSMKGNSCLFFNTAKLVLNSNYKINNDSDGRTRLNDRAT